MFKIKYKYQKGGPLYSCKYPNEKDESNNIFIIRGTNDHGKSTIMQMVALGLFSDDEPELSKILKQKIKRLLADSVDKCEFNFKIESKDHSIKIDSELKNRHVNIKVNGKDKPRTYIQENFKVLFDVPEEPMVKLNSSLTSIEHNLSQYILYSEYYLQLLDKYIQEMESEDEKEKRIISEKKELESKKKSLKNIKDRLTIVESNLVDLEKANLMISYESKSRNLGEKNEDITKLRKRIKKLESDGAKGGNYKYLALITDFMQARDDLKFSINTSNELLGILDSDEKRELEKVRKEVNKIVSTKDLNDTNLKLWYTFFNKIIKRLENDPIFSKKLVEEDEIALINRLIPILKEFIDIDTTIPGTDGKTVGEFINTLEITRETVEKKIKDKINRNKWIELCYEINKKLGILATARGQVPNKDDKLNSEYDALKKEQSDLENEIKKIRLELGKLEMDYSNIPDKDKEKLRLMRDKVERNYTTFKREKTSLISLSDEHDKIIQSKDLLIKELLKKKPVIKKIDATKLKIKSRKISEILRKLSSWKDYAKKLDLNDVGSSTGIKKESKPFYEVLGDYFTDLLKVVYFENKSWELKTIDILNRSYVVKGRKPIEFIDPGTGHNALNSLLARIKQDYGGKKKILLIDEIGDMDPTNIKIFIGEIKKQVNEQKVILALLTKMEQSDKVVLEPVSC